MATKEFSIKEALSFAWKAIFKNIWFWISLVLIAFLISWINSQITNATGNEALKSVVDVVFFLISTYISIGILRISLKTVDNKKTDYADLKISMRTYANYILASILCGIAVSILPLVVVVIGIVTNGLGSPVVSIIFGALLLAAIVVSIYIAVALTFFGYLIVDKNYTPVLALRESMKITKGNKGALLLMFLTFLGIIVLGAIALVVGLVIAVPLIWLATAYIYRKLSGSVQAK